MGLGLCVWVCWLAPLLLASSANTAASTRDGAAHPASTLGQHFVLTGIPSGDHLRPTDTFTVAVTAAAADGRDVTGDGYHGNGGFAGDATANVICNGSFALASSKPAVANVTGQHCRPTGTGANATWAWVATIEGVAPGRTELRVVNTLTGTVVTSHYIRVIRSLAIPSLNVVIGWVYFVAWSFSFYPQVRYNYLRKSVVGLNFDFLAYNLTGFFGYLVYNAAMFWSSFVKRQYKELHGADSTEPVQLNDVIFTVHAVILTLITISQTFVYSTGGQRISLPCKVLLTGAWSYIILAGVAASLASHGPLSQLRWLNYLSGLGYIKIGVTLVKYIPQALMNFRRQSTEGWSIGNVLLDFTGGFFSFLQMFLQYWNNDDPSIFVGDPTKLGLSVFSMLFDVMFMFQHYVLYRGAPPAPDSGRDKRDVEYQGLLNEDRIGAGRRQSRVKPSPAWPRRGSRTMASP